MKKTIILLDSKPILSEYQWEVIFPEFIFKHAEKYDTIKSIMNAQPSLALLLKESSFKTFSAPERIHLFSSDIPTILIKESHNFNADSLFTAVISTPINPDKLWEILSHIYHHSLIKKD